MLLLETSHQGRACVPYMRNVLCVWAGSVRRSAIHTGDLVLLLGEEPKTEHASQGIVHNIMVTSLNHTKGDTGGIGGTSSVW